MKQEHWFPDPRWINKFRHANKGAKGVRVYYLMSSTDIICSDIAVRTRRNTVEFLGGGWCDTKDCFLTKGQCRRATGLEVKERINKAKSVLARAAEALQEGEQRLQGLLHDIDESNR